MSHSGRIHDKACLLDKAKTVTRYANAATDLNALMDPMTVGRGHDIEPRHECDS